MRRSHRLGLGLKASAGKIASLCAGRERRQREKSQVGAGFEKHQGAKSQVSAGLKKHQPAKSQVNAGHDIELSIGLGVLLLDNRGLEPPDEPVANTP